MAQFYNANKPQNKPATDARAFHPFAPKPKPKKATAEDLQKLFGPDWQKHV
jgi:hypothetical protein